MTRTEEARVKSLTSTTSTNADGTPGCFDFWVLAQ